MPRLRLDPAWRLPALTIAAGVLLAVLAIALAAWSKQLLKASFHNECAERAAEVIYEVGRELDRREAAVLRGEALPPAVAAAWRLGPDGVVVGRRPAGASDPEPLLVERARDARGPGPQPITLHGGAEPTAAVWLPFAAPEPDGARGVLLRWDLATLEAEVLDPLMARGDPRYAVARVEISETADVLPFHPKAALTLPPRLSFWRVAVGLRDPDSARSALRVQTALLGALAVWLLVVIVGAAVLHARRTRVQAARQADRDRFLTRATHELQTPLALLRAAAESLDRGAVSEPDDVARCLRIVAREEERLTRGLRRLLRYLRRENEPDPELAPLDEVVEGAVSELRGSLEAQGIAVALEPGGAGALVARDLVGDVLRELLGNVERHARGARRVTVTVRAPGRRAVVTVGDDGEGDPALVARAVADAPGARPGADGGLGLPLVRRGVELTGGRVDVRPGRDGRGVAVDVEVPCRRT